MDRTRPPVRLEETKQKSPAPTPPPALPRRCHEAEGQIAPRAHHRRPSLRGTKENPIYPLHLHYRKSARGDLPSPGPCQALARPSPALTTFSQGPEHTLFGKTGKEESSPLQMGPKTPAPWPLSPCRPEPWHLCFPTREAVRLCPPRLCSPRLCPPRLVGSPNLKGNYVLPCPLLLCAPHTASWGGPGRPLLSSWTLHTDVWAGWKLQGDSEEGPGGSGVSGLHQQDLGHHPQPDFMATGPKPSLAQA